MARREFSRSVRVAAIKRCRDDKGTPRCEQCHAVLKGKHFAFDHIIADGLTGAPTIENCQVLCTGIGSCHDRKTREQDVPAIAEAKRREAKHLGVTGERRTIESAPFAKPPKRCGATTPVIKRAPGPSAIERRLGGQS